MAEKVKNKGQVDAFLDKIQKSKRFQGTAQVCRASELTTPYYLRRPSGVPQLDLALGGGFHAGGVAQLYGGESVGKTYLSYQTAGMVQRNYGNAARILILAVEIRPDKGFARQAGFCVGYSNDEISHFDRIRKRNGLEPFTTEEKRDLHKQIGEVVIVTADTGDTGLDVVVEALQEGFFQLAIIESLGALLTPDQEAGDVGDRVYGGSSIMVTNFQNKIYPLYMMNREDGTMLETTILGINQARAVIGGSPKGPKERPAAGAYAWKHGQLASIELRKGETLWADASHTKKSGREVKWDIKKGKAGCHDGIKGSYHYFHVPKRDPVFWADVEANKYAWGIDSIYDLVGAAKQTGAVETSGAWITWKENSHVLIKAQGESNFVEELSASEELIEKLSESCLRASNLPVRYT